MTNKEQSRLTLDDLLKLDPSEMSEDILKPMKIISSLPLDARECETLINMVKNEIQDIKLKFEANNNSYDIQDLMKLTENSRRILMERLTTSCIGDEHSAKNDSDSVYFDLELKRMKLEKSVGLNVFLEVYRQMLDILNGNPGNDITGDRVISGTATFVIQKDSHAGEYKKPIEKTWMTIIERFGSKQEYIPDIWECAVRESVYY